MVPTDLETTRLPWPAADPYPFYEARRSDGDVVWDDAAHAWLVLGYEPARLALGGHGWTSDPFANPITAASMDVFSRDLAGSSMLFADGANHGRLRGSVRDVFTRSFIDNLGTGVEAIASAVIAGPTTGEPFDFMSEIALPLPIAVIGEWLGLDPTTAELLRELSPAIIRTLGTLANPDEFAAGAAASAALLAEFLPMAADRRANPGDDLLSFIAGDDALNLEDVAMTAILIAVAGHETTANLLGTGLIRLLGPGPADHVDPTDSRVVNELLRLDGPVQATVRTATEDHVLGEAHILTGQTAIVCVAAANRDPAAFVEPDQFRLDRTGPAHLSFGYGPHYCLGVWLAQLETRIALGKILDRRPVLVGLPTWREAPAIRGPRALPIMFRN